MRYFRIVYHLSNPLGEFGYGEFTLKSEKYPTKSYLKQLMNVEVEGIVNSNCLTSFIIITIDEMNVEDYLTYTEKEGE
jgi:hypothetical protein